MFRLMIVFQILWLSLESALKRVLFVKMIFTILVTISKFLGAVRNGAKEIFTVILRGNFSKIIFKRYSINVSFLMPIFLAMNGLTG